MRFQKGVSQSFFSIIMLTVLVIIGAGIFLKQSRYDLTDYIQPLETKIAVNNSHLDLPVPPGYFGEKAEIFDSENLYSKIDGKADLYLDSGFRQLDCRVLKSSADPNLWMEFFVYDMNTPKNALAVFGVQRRPEGENIGIGDFGYKTSDAMFFEKGKYYVEVTGSASSNQLMNAMEQAGAEFVKKIGNQAGQIEELSLFPKEKLVPQSFKMYVSSAYGFDGFKELYAASYGINDSNITAFICKQPDAAAAKKLADDYRKFLSDNGGTAKSASNLHLKNAVFDMGGEFEIILAKGPFVSGVHAAEKQADAEAVALMLQEQLK